MDESTFKVIKTHFCPTCGHETDSNEGLNVTFEEFKGNYCLKCWAKWISENIPKLQEK